MGGGLQRERMKGKKRELKFQKLVPARKYLRQENGGNIDTNKQTKEIRKVKNGIIVTLRTDDDTDDEYVYDTDRKAIKFVKDLLESKNVSKHPEG